MCRCLGSWAALQPLNYCHEGSTNSHCVQAPGQGIEVGLTRSLEAFQDAVLLCDSQTDWQVVFVNNPARRQLGELLAQALACYGSHGGPADKQCMRAQRPASTCLQPCSSRAPGAAGPCCRLLTGGAWLTCKAAQLSMQQSIRLKLGTCGIVLSRVLLRLPV